MQASSLPRPSLSEEAYSEIREALLQGEFEPGQRLSEPELAWRFSTSRSPIREALVRLDLEGFVERMTNGRVRVRALDLSELAQLYVVRANIEGLVARLAAPRLRTIDLEQMDQALVRMERSVKKGEAVDAIRHGQKFHDLLLRECGNEPLIQVLSGLKGKISRFRAVVASFGNYDAERLTEHRRILDALYRRSGEQAEKEMIAHVNRSAAVLMARLQSRN